MMNSMFEDRVDAGKQLAKKLANYKNKKTIVLAIPRGGVVVAKEVAKFLNSELDLIIPRKIGYPGDPEFAIGAVAEDGSLVLDEKTIQEFDVSKSYIDETVKKEIAEIKRRMKKYRGKKPSPKLVGKIVIIVDDGIATGHTIEAAVLSVKKQKPEKIIVAVPVAPKESIKKLRKIVSEIICLEIPESFYAIGMHYINFNQVTDEEVIELLKK